MKNIGTILATSLLSGVVTLGSYKLFFEENALLNNVELEYLDDLYKSEQVDVLLAADVLYDQCNRFFLDEFLKFAPEVWIADSRVKNFSHPKYMKIDERSATTWPDLDEAKEFRNVSFYKTL